MSHYPALGAQQSALSPRTIERLDAYVTSVLACPAAQARAGGVHVIAAPRRALPAWHGYVLPIAGVSYPAGAVLAVRPDLADRLTTAMGSDVHLPRLDHIAWRRVYRAVLRLASFAFSLMGDMRAVDEETFRPSATEFRAGRIPRDDPAALHLRNRFDGELFGARGPNGRLVSWAALKLKSHDVWEVAVTTEPEYRGRGYARDVVSAATRYTLEQGRLCLYVHDDENRTSAFVSRTLGYQRYAEVILVEY
jgi:RimJ/RimL family protein N-acetyltransferase